MLRHIQEKLGERFTPLGILSHVTLHKYFTSQHYNIVTVTIMPWSQPNAVVNKANLRDLIAATGLVTLLKLDSNRRFFSPCDREICIVL